MRRLKTKKRIKRNTRLSFLAFVFFLIILLSFILFNNYAKKNSEKINILVSEEIDTVIYQIFNEYIDKDVIKEEGINNLLEINRNKKDEIISVNYDLENTYKILENIATNIKDNLNDLEKGKITVQNDNRYLMGSKYGLIMKVPLFIGSQNIFLNNLGPKIPVVVNLNEALLTNIKTKVTNYGFNNALLEIYVTVEIQKLIITPVIKDKNKFQYDILIGALVINGSVPDFYGEEYVKNSSILDIPMNESL